MVYVSESRAGNIGLSHLANGLQSLLILVSKLITSLPISISSSVQRPGAGGRKVAMVLALLRLAFNAANIATKAEDC